MGSSPRKGSSLGLSRLDLGSKIPALEANQRGENAEKRQVLAHLLWLLRGKETGAAPH